MTGKLGIASILVLSASAFAHHAYTAEFDTTKPIKLTGVLKKVEWANPHIWLYLDVTEESGKITSWGFSASPPGMLTRRGITKTSLKLGEVLTISGHFRAKGWLEQRLRKRCDLLGRTRRFNRTGPSASATAELVK